MNKKTIALITATRYEADPIIKDLQLNKEFCKHFKIFTNNKIHLIISGVGKVNAALAVQYLLQKYDSEIVVNVGAAGAVNNNLALGEIYQIIKIYESDRFNLYTQKPMEFTPPQIAGIASVKLATADIPVITNKERSEAGKYVDLVDMEAAAIAMTAEKYKKKYYIFKYVSDIPADFTDKEFKPADITSIKENMKKYSINISRYLVDNILSLL